MTTKDPGRDTVSQVISENGGTLSGTTRLQKTVYLAQKSLGQKLFGFIYHYYGPYSTDLAAAIERAREASLIVPEEHVGHYNLNYVRYTSKKVGPNAQFKAPELKKLLSILDKYDAIVLELAATWLYLEQDEVMSRNDSLAALQQLKPSKASTKRIEEAKKLLKEIRLH